MKHYYNIIMCGKPPWSSPFFWKPDLSSTFWSFSGSSSPSPRPALPSQVDY